MADSRRLARLLDHAFSVYVTLVALACALVTCPLLLAVPGADRRRRIARFGTRMIFVLSGIRLRASGLEHLPAGPCIVVANHRSYFDGLALIAALPPGFSPVIKASVGDVPILGRVMDRAGSVYVRRRPVHAAGVDTLRLIRRTRAGISPAMFSEGTLSPDLGLLPLREGAFLVAARTGLPVVPVAVTGTDAILPSGGRRIRFGAAGVSVGLPQHVAGPRRADARRLRDAVEIQLWQLLSPATGDWRRTLRPEAYYRRVFAQKTTPLACLDVDELTTAVRDTLRSLRSPALRLDARALIYPSIGARVWRSDVRFTGLLVADVEQAIDWLETGEFADAVIVAEHCVEASLRRAALWQARHGQLTFAVRTPDEIDAIDRAACARGVVLQVVAHGAAGALPGAGFARHAPAGLIEACRGRPGVRMRGVLVDAQATKQRVLADRHDPEQRLGLEQSMRDHATLRDEAGVVDIVVGRELFDAHRRDGDARPVITFRPAATAATPAEVHRSGLALISVYGGAIVGENRAPARAPAADALSESRHTAGAHDLMRRLQD